MTERCEKRWPLLIAAILWATPSLAQQSATYKLTESVFNGGGNPANGTILTSTSYKMSLDAIGDGAIAAGLWGGPYRMDAGFVSAYPPPGETLGLCFTGKQTLTWNPEKSVGTYNLYRDAIPALPGGMYGLCSQPGLTRETATDTAVPGAGVGYFYLVTAENRLQEEGTKGYRKNGTERPNPAPCP